MENIQKTNGDVIIDVEPLEKSEAPKKWIEWNRIFGFLWGAKSRDLAEIDEAKTHLKYGNVDSPIKKAGYFEIFILKYVSALLLVWFVIYDVNLYYPSMLAVGLSILTFVTLKKFKEKIPLSVFYLLLLGASIGFIIYGFSSNDEYHISFIMNYMFQYLIALFILNKVYQDILNKGFDGYYSIAKKPFKFIKIYDNENDIGTPSKLTPKAEKVVKLSVKIGLIFVMVFSFVAGTVSLVHELNEERVQKVFKEQFGDVNNIDYNSVKWQKYLDDRAAELGVVALHKIKDDRYWFFNNIETYVVLNVTPNTEYSLVYTSKFEAAYTEFLNGLSKKHDDYKAKGGTLNQKDFLAQPTIKKEVVRELEADGMIVSDEFDYERLSFAGAWDFAKSDIGAKTFETKEEVKAFVLNDEFFFIRGDVLKNNFELFKVRI